MKYTVDDCEVLRNHLRDTGDPLLSLCVYDEIINIARIRMQSGVLSDSDINDLVGTWLYKHFGSSAHKIYDFMFRTELLKVGLFINDKELELFMKWRLKIAK